MSDNLSQKWKDRFEFFEKIGGNVASKEYKARLKEMKFFSRIKYMSNFYAFFFGLIYMCIIGLWKKGLVLFSGVFIINILLAIFSEVTGTDVEAVSRLIGVAYCGICSCTANYAYYLKEVKGIQGWNPFEGFTKKSAAKINQS